MSAKMLNSLTDEKRNIRKQIGCMNGIFQLFDRHHFLMGRRMSSHNHKKLLLGAQHQLEPHNATKAVITEKEKPRLSTDSSQSSSYSSSTFSSVDHNKKAQSQRPSRRHTCIPENQLEIVAIKEQEPPSIKGPKSPHIRDVVKGSMHREARGVSIKSFSSDERKVTVMKHIDSPRPLHHSKFGKKSNDDERPISLARFSYDGRESRDSLKTSMKLKELPRLSLDSRASSMKSSSALDSRSSFFGRDLHKEHEKSSQAGPVNQETGGHSRSSSIVAKLMGLEDFPADTISTEFLSESSTRAEESKKKQASLSQPVSQKNLGPSSPRLRDANSIRKSTVETAPWKQQESGPKTSGQSRKASTNIPRTSSSVYGEIEKRITELEFKRSGKDLRALKQILEAMQKTRERLDSSGGEPDKGMENAKISTSSQMGTQKVQFLQTQDHRYQSKNLAQREKAQDFLPRNNMKEPSRRISSVNKKNTWRNLEPECTPRVPQLMKVENCSTSGRVFSMVSPRSKQNVYKIERQSHPNNLSLESNGAKKHSCKKVREKFPQNRKHKVKSMDLQLNDDQTSELISETRQSSYHGDTASIKSEVVSDIEVEVLSLANAIKTNSRQQQNSVSSIKEHMWGVEPVVTTVEQPSPVSVLDSAFYSEDSPSPVKKISTAFREDESQSPDEAEWHLESLNNLSFFTKYEPGIKNDQKPERLLLINEPVLLKTEGIEATADHSGAVYWSLSPDHRYINKILKASGLFKETSIMPTTHQLLLSSPLISPDIFHALEETEDPFEEANGELVEKNDQVKSIQKVERKIVFDAVNEMVVRKITSDRLFSLGGKRMSTEGLIKDVYLEMNYLCRIPYSNLDDEVDPSIRLLAADMKYQSDEWTDQSGDFSALVLDIERLIFKDLINEVVTGEVEGVPDWPKRHRRQLF